MAMNETVRDLLIRLTVRILIPLRSVWSGLLGRSSFILDHLNYHSNKNPLLIIERFYWDQQRSGLELFLFEIQSKKIQKLYVPGVTDSDVGFKIVGSCNGLICVCHYSHDPSSCIFLWNPATSQIRRILEHSNDALLPHKAPPYCLLGFSYNASANDYEVVRIYHPESRNSGILHAIQIERYSLNSGFWDEVVYSNHYDATVNGPFVLVDNSVTVKRKMFWVAMTTRNQRFSEDFIVSFDVENNMLRRISLPNFDNFEISKKLTEYREYLGLLFFSESAANKDYCCLELWVYDDNEHGFDSWIRLKTIGLFQNMARPVGMWKDEVFIASGNVIQSVRSDDLKAALLPSAQVADDCCYVSLNYAESLVVVNNGGNCGVQINEADGGNSDSNNKDGSPIVRMVFKKLTDGIQNKLNIIKEYLKRSVLKTPINFFCNVIFYFLQFFRCQRIL